MPQKRAQWPLLEPLFVNLTVPSGASPSRFRDDTDQRWEAMLISERALSEGDLDAGIGWRNLASDESGDSQDPSVLRFSDRVIEQ